MRRPYGNVVSVSMTADHLTVASGTLDTNTYIYSRKDNSSFFSLSQKIFNDGVMVSVLVMANSGQTLVIGGYTGRAKVYKRDASEYVLMQTINKQSISVRSLDLSPDESFIAIGYQDGNIAVYQLDTTSKKYELQQSITTLTTPVISISLIAGMLMINNKLNS